MSFFKDFKDDLSMAVNELLPGEDLDTEDELEESSEMMVNTLEGELDIESELSKLDGLLEHVDTPEEVKHVEIEPEEPVLEKTKEKEPVSTAKPSSMPKPAAVQKPSVQKPSVQKESPAKDERKTEMSDSRFRSLPESEPVREKNTVKTNEKEAQKTDPKNKPVNQHMNTQKNRDEELHFSFDMLTEEPKPQPRMKPAADPFMNNAFHNNNNNYMKTSTTFKEEIPMNEEMTKETTTMALEGELTTDTPEITDEVSIITTGTTIKGNLSTTGSFSISGRVEGNVQCNGKLEVTGTIKGNSSSSEVFSDAAKIEGEIMSTGTVKIGLGSVVVGNIAATSAVIAGAVKGDIDVQGPVVVDTSAVIVGNIKSRSVQINNGAVIEGFCSQCYADIDVESLFGENKKGK